MIRESLTPEFYFIGAYMNNREKKKEYGDLAKQIMAIAMSPLVFGRVKTSLQNIVKMLLTADDSKYQDLMRWVKIELEFATQKETKAIWAKVFKLFQEYFQTVEE
jgi:hypothetical protein